MLRGGSYFAIVEDSDMLSEAVTDRLQCITGFLDGGIVWLFT